MYTIGLILAIVGIAVFTLIYFIYGGEDEGGSSGQESGDFWTCSGRGCKQYEYGEHRTKEQCYNSCKSYVNEKGEGCKRTQGIPWNSFSDLNACRLNT